MSKKGKNALVPKLRFPEFIGKEEWIIKKFNQLFSIGNGRDYKHLLSGNVPVYGSGGYMLSVNDYLYEGESVCIGRKGTIDKPIFLTGKFWTVDTLFYTHSFSNCLPVFIFLIFQQINWIKHNEAGGVPSLSKTNIEKIVTAIPPIEEQQKIADCFTSLDKLITAEKQKLDALKTHKKGLMQKLFPAESETVPKQRFPEFRGKGAWEEKTIQQVAQYENGKAHEQDISEHGKYIVVNSKFISTEGEVKKYSNTANLLAKTGDILMVLSDVPNGRAIAKCFYVDKDKTYTVNQRICKLTPKNANGLVLQYIINRNKYFLAFDDGVKQTNLKNDDVLNCPIVLPDNLNEQQKIADCLISLDELITAQSQKIENLKALKKSLMQQLFPQVEEVVE